MGNPWTQAPWFLNPVALSVHDDDNNTICEMATATTETDAIEQEANARLIQHAPEMVEALEAVNYELAALVADPANPDFSVALPNPADAECVAKAFAAVRALLARIRGDAP
jgi:hypothetical protein